ncbi:HD domain-containing protein [Kineococcus sp. R8]|uniref:HD domain-containing protein n=1 Tax=Kineococcus siccus TaxID=2696567 RepID=UPI001411F632|nr:HD domain-containing protein [Kineococcus siccus]
MSEFPETPLARTAHEFLVGGSAQTLVNHSLRSYLFARRVADLRGLRPDVDFDDEVVFVSCALHDVGLTEAGNGDQRFEVDGADLAVRVLRDAGMAADRTSLVWDAIALHTSAGIADRKAPEIALSFYGIALDVFGLGAEQFPGEVLAGVHAGRPRLQLADELARMVVDQTVDKPAKAPPLSFPSLLVGEVRGAGSVPDFRGLVAAGPWGS